MAQLPISEPGAPAPGAPPTELTDPALPVEEGAPGGEGEPGEGDTYHLHISLNRGTTGDEGEVTGEAVAEDAWEFEAADDDEAAMVAVQVLADTFGGMGPEGMPGQEGGLPGVPVEGDMGAGMEGGMGGGMGGGMPPGMGGPGMPPGAPPGPGPVG